MTDTTITEEEQALITQAINLQGKALFLRKSVDWSVWDIELCEKDFEEAKEAHAEILAKLDGDALEKAEEHSEMAFRSFHVRAIEDVKAESFRKGFDAGYAQAIKNMEALK